MPPPTTLVPTAVDKTDAAQTIKNPYTGKPVPPSLWAILQSSDQQESVQLNNSHAPYYALRFIKDKSNIINNPYEPLKDTFFMVNIANIPDNEKDLVKDEIKTLSLFNLVHTADNRPNTYYIHPRVFDFYKDKTTFETTYTIPGLYWEAFIPRLRISDTHYLATQLDHILHRLEERYSDEILYGHSSSENTGARTRN